MSGKEETTRTPETSETLLKNIAARADSPAWDEFARIYGPALKRYASKENAGFRPVSEFDCDDLAQDAFVTVKSIMPGFRYDRGKGRFRAFLHKIVHNKVLTLRRRMSRAPEPVDDSVLEAGEPVAGGASSGDRELVLRVWSLALASALSGIRLEPNTKAAYRRLVLEGKSVDSVAREFNLKANAVYQIKNRVNRAVRKELLSAAHGKKDLGEVIEVFLERQGIHL